MSAGTWTATNTRMTTMKAANESARHAANAILHLIMMPFGDLPQDNDPLIFGGQGMLFGDEPKFFRRKELKLDDLEVLREVDEKLAQQDRPHLVEILKAEELIDELPMKSFDEVKTELDNFRALITELESSFVGHKTAFGRSAFKIFTKGFADAVNAYAARFYQPGDD